MKCCLLSEDQKSNSQLKFLESYHEEMISCQKVTGEVEPLWLILIK